jgi:hypothetical protein
MATDGRYDLRIKQGATFARGATYRTAAGVAIDLTGYTIRAMIRATYDAAQPLASLTCAIDNPTAGHFTFGLSATQTAGLSATGSAAGQRASYVWDLEIEKAGVVDRILAGSAYVSPEATK